MRRKHARRWGVGFALAAGLAGLAVPPATAADPATAPAPVTAPVTAPAPAKAEPLRMGGTGGATETLRLLGARYDALNGSAHVEVLPGLGSGGAIAAAMDGALHLAVSGRDLTPAETARGLGVALSLCTPYVLATSRGAPSPLDRAAVPALYERAAPHWPDGHPVKVILRPRNESDNQVLFRVFPGTEAAVEQARKRDSVPIAATDQDNADMGEQIADSLIASTYAQVITERRSLRMIPIDGVAPDLAAYEGGRYPYGKRLRVVAPRAPAPEVARFLDFLRSPEGLAVLRGAGVIPCPAVD